MATTTAERATEVVKAAEDIVASAAASESKETVGSVNGQVEEARAWDAKAQID